MKNILITGASGFLGTATTKHFLQTNYRVMAIVHNEKSKEALSSHPHLHTFVLDLTDTHAVVQTIQQMVATYQQIHGCLLLAGGFTPGKLGSGNLEKFRQQVSMNFETAYNVVSAVFAHMKEKKEGRIVFIGSQPVLMPEKAAGSIEYTLSKSLLFQLAAILNAQSTDTNVISHIIVPGTIDTAANRKAMPDADFSKWAKPEEIAATLELLCTDVTRPWKDVIIKV